MDQVEAEIGVLGQGAGVAHRGGEQRVAHLEGLRIHQGDGDLVGLEEVAVEQPQPIFRLAAEIDDPHPPARGENLFDQLLHPPRPRAAEARGERVGVGGVLKRVDQVHAWDITSAA